MPRKQRTGTRRFDRRVRLWKPGVAEINPDNPYNEKDRPGDYVVAYPSYPANRFDSLTEIDEKERSNVVRAASEVEWELQWIPNMGLASGWKIEDLFDGVTYQVTSPLTEIGRGLSYRVITDIIE